MCLTKVQPKVSVKSLSEEVLGARSLDFEGGGKLLELGQVFGPCLCSERY